MEAGQGSAMARLTRPLPSLPTMSNDRIGRSYSSRGYSTQCSTCHGADTHHQSQLCGNVFSTLHRHAALLKEDKHLSLAGICLISTSSTLTTIPA